MRKTARVPALVTALAAATALVLAGCSSNDKSDNTGGTDTEGGTCPTAPATRGEKPAVTFLGSPGEAEIVAPTATHAPGVTVQAPFGVTETKVETLSEGEGPAITVDDMVSVCYIGVNGRDGKIFDSAYERGTPAAFPLTQVVTGFQKAIVGQKPGAKVAVAMTPDDGYGPMGGNAEAGIQPTDSLIFVIKIQGVVPTDGSE